MNLPFISLDLATQDPQTLKGVRNWPETKHVFDADSIWALNAALATGRPLLLRGEPGTGKSQLARAAAKALEWPFISRVVNARFEPEDLLYRFDAVARLAQAQVHGTTGNLDPSLFLLPEVLWWALDHSKDELGAEGQYMKASPQCGEAGCKYNQDTGEFAFSADKGVVVLVDEIDKADSDVPNSLLEILSVGGFQLPYGGGFVKAKGTPPLIIITTNEDRELPPAFLRRCLVHQMDLPKLPEKEDDFDDHLKKRVKAHFPNNEISTSALNEALNQLKKDRLEAQRNDLPPPGQAELLDLLKAVALFSSDEGEQVKALGQLIPLAFRKHRPV